MRWSRFASVLKSDAFTLRDMCMLVYWGRSKRPGGFGRFLLLNQIPNLPERCVSGEWSTEAERHQGENARGGIK